MVLYHKFSFISSIESAGAKNFIHCYKNKMNILLSVVQNNNRGDEKMKYTTALTGAILIIFIIISSIFTPANAKEGIPQEHSSSDSQTSAIQFNTAQPLLCRYTLSVYEGKVAAFENGNNTPFYISNRMVSDLPEKDRTALENGIGADTIKALNRLIEDYCS